MTGSRRSCRGSSSGAPTRFLPVKGVDRARGGRAGKRHRGGRSGSDAQCPDGQRPLELSLPGHPEGRIRRLRSPESSRPGHSTRRSASRTKNHPALHNRDLLRREPIQLIHIRSAALVASALLASDLFVARRGSGWLRVGVEGEGAGRGKRMPGDDGVIPPLFYLIWVQSMTATHNNHIAHTTAL